MTAGGRAVARRTSIRDVAAEAGVSVTTVSHVLNQVDGTRVSERTRERVEAAARRLGYSANGLARGLRLQRSQTLALLSDKIATTPYAGRIILGAQETASARGWLLMLLTTGDDPEVERREIRALMQHRVDGVLYATMYHSRVTVPDTLRALPVVLLDAASDDADVPSVVPDEVGGGRLAVRELLDHGHREIGFLTNVDDIPATHGRMRGYREALAAAGVPYRDDLVVVEESDTAGGYRAARRLLDRPDRPTAMFCFNDRMAMGAYRAAAECGAAVPHDLSIVGFDNQDLIADGLHPGLTTVALPHYEMGAWAVQTIIDLLDTPDGERPPAPRTTMPCPLIRRASVAAPAR
jgi:LacI family transcriptional regulator